MIPYIDFDAPFRALHLPIHMFGVLVFAAIALGSWATHRRAGALGLDEERVRQMIGYALIFGFISSHLFDVLAYQKNASLLDWLNPLGGLSSYGGFAGGLVGMLVWCQRFSQPRLPYADALAFGMAPGWTVGRLGCFAAHDHPGLLTRFPLAVSYPDGARHDLGLDEALFAFLVTLVFVALSRRNRPAGFYVALICLLYAPVRFVLDYLRVGDARYLGLTPAQYASLAVLGVGICLARQKMMLVMLK
jgi:phosphatidylglycerol:prolipoprotein diacylglycerol transferase